jgi:hypothetical protein
MSKKNDVGYEMSVFRVFRGFTDRAYVSFCGRVNSWKLRGHGEGSKDVLHYHDHIMESSRQQPHNRLDMINT